MGACSKLLGMVTYVDWVMILVTLGSVSAMMFENPRVRTTTNVALQMAEWMFVSVMSLELALKIMARGFIFTPAALLADFSGFLDLFIYLVCLRLASSSSFLIHYHYYSSRWRVF